MATASEVLHTFLGKAFDPYWTIESIVEISDKTLRLTGSFDCQTEIALDMYVCLANWFIVKNVRKGQTDMDGWQEYSADICLRKHLQ
jgi:hypothetical protein